MKIRFVILIILISAITLFAQSDTITSKKKIDSYSIRSDSVKNQMQLNVQLPARTLIIKMKDLPKIKNISRKNFIVIDDTSNFTSDELSISLSEKGWENYKKNKKKLSELLIPPLSEEVTYPTATMIRKILSVAKTIGVIIIFILSL